MLTVYKATDYESLVKAAEKKRSRAFLTQVIVMLKCRQRQERESAGSVLFIVSFYTEIDLRVWSVNSHCTVHAART